jgi:carboxypeptidase Q
MHIRFLLPSVAFCLGLTAFQHRVHAAATPEAIAEKLAANGLTNSVTMKVVTDLTTEVGPRFDGSEAEKRAADWAKRRFEELGFDNVRIETFPLPHRWERGVEQARIVRPSPQPLVVTALGGSVATPADGIEAEVAFFHSFDALLAAPTGSLSGKIAVVTQPMARVQDGGGYGVAVRARHAGASEAARRGAVAYLLRSVATDHHRIAHTGVMEYAEGAPRIPAAALSVPDADQLERLVAKGEPVRIRLILTPRDAGPGTSQNVIAEIKGRETPDEIVLLGAHLDSWDLGTGAIDDGAGVAIVMAAAKLIRELPQAPRRTIRFVLYGSEEMGLFGGEAYAVMHKQELAKHVIATEADLGQGPVYRFQTGVADPAEPTLKRIGAALAPLAIVPGDNASEGDSDTEPLFKMGVPVATLQLDAMDYFDFHHTADDTVDKIEPERINQSAAAHAVFAYLAAELGGNFRAKAVRR